MSPPAARHRPRPPEDAILDDGAPGSPPQRMLVGLVVALPLLFGGVHPEVRLLALCVALVALALKLRSLAAEGRRPSFGPWGLALGLASAAALLQVVPLPATLVAALSPERLAVAQRLAYALGDPPPDWLPLGLDPGRVALGAVGLALFFVAWLLGRHGRLGELGRVRLVLAVEVAACAVVAVGVLHAALGWEGLYGLHGGPHAGGPFPATFMNPNHLAALCLMAALVAFGAAIHDKVRAGWHAGAAAVASFGVLASLSRANALLLVAGLGLVALPWLGIRWPSRHAKGHDESPPERVVRARRLGVGLGALVFIALVLAGPERWAVELGTLLPDAPAEADGGTPPAVAPDAGPASPPSGLSTALGARFGLVSGCWGVAWGVAQAFPWTGAGVGNLALATPAFTDDWTTGRITHAHHAALEVAGELGLPLAAALGVLALAGFVLAWRRARADGGDPLLWGALVALGAVTVQNLVDFSLWIPGVGVPAAALAGLVSRPHGGPPAMARGPRRSPRAVGGPLVLAFGLLAGLGALVMAPPSGLGAASPGGLLSDAEVPRDWRSLVRSHGADFSVLEVAGAAAERAGEGPAARRLAEVALSLDPNGPGPLGRAFKFAVLDGRDGDAAQHLERLYVQGDAGREAAFSLALASGARPVIQARFFGHDPGRVLRAAEILRYRGEGEAARALVAWAIDALGHHLALVEAWALTLAPGPSQAETLAQLGSLCLAQAVRRAEAEAASPSGSPVPGGTAQAWERLGLLVEGEHQRALGLPLAAWSRFMAAAAVGVPETPSGQAGPGPSATGLTPTEAAALEAALPDAAARATRSRALFRAGEAALAAGRLDRLEETLALLDAVALPTAQARAARHILRSERFAALGQTREAIREVQQALRLAPSDPAHHDRLAPLFEQAGDPEAAARARARADGLRAGPRTPER
jgi:Flp pilus assembly protein TadD